MRTTIPKILIADDDPSILRLLELRLAKYGDRFHPLFASDGQEAIDILKQEEISLVVTDIAMPKMNGLVLLAYVHAYYPRIRCFVMTAYATRRLKGKVPHSVVRFFQKPLQMDDFVQAILAALERDEPPRTAEGISIVTFLEMIEMEALTCKVEMEDPNHAIGVLLFKNGVLYDAACDGLDGERAAIELIRRKIRAYRFKDLPDGNLARKIKTDMQDLIRNAVKHEPETELPLD